MYTISNRLKIVSVALMLLGALGWGYSYISSDVSVEDVKTMLAEEEASHGGHEAPATDTHGEEASHDAAADHGDEHAEHVMHQIHNRPYSALYVAAFFFFMNLMNRAVILKAFVAVGNVSLTGVDFNVNNMAYNGTWGLHSTVRIYIFLLYPH